MHCCLESICELCAFDTTQSIVMYAFTATVLQLRPLLQMQRSVTSYNGVGTIKTECSTGN